MLTFRTDPDVVRRIFRPLGLPDEPPRLEPVRFPPEQRDQVQDRTDGC